MGCLRRSWGLRLMGFPFASCIALVVVFKKTLRPSRVTWPESTQDPCSGLPSLGLVVALGLLGELRQIEGAGERPSPAGSPVAPRRNFCPSASVCGFPCNRIAKFNRSRSVGACGAMGVAWTRFPLGVRV